jgi:hypothetical protein
MAIVGSSLSPCESMEQLVAFTRHWQQTGRRGHRRAMPGLVVSRCFDARDCSATAGPGGRRQRPAARGCEFAPRRGKLVFAVADFTNIIELFVDWSCEADIWKERLGTFFIDMPMLHA